MKSLSTQRLNQSKKRRKLDAKSFAEFGIPSVNLSAGYLHEHTDDEVVDYKATYETVKLIEAVLHEGLIEGARLIL
ncbi:hypothetical protein [Alkalihalobacillus deserti]|uniref:hypothetical protein n=1 Tax=Alkalihalobacillus deserti TaxID=2879466 RepID=UPI001D13AE67|nr:hypothetical protein [Alkalihalobacillus deserti]